MPYEVDNCSECNGEPILYVARVKKMIAPSNGKDAVITRHLTRHKLGTEPLYLETYDMVAAYCSRCEQPIEIEYVESGGRTKAK